MQGVNVKSEIGNLKKVILHRPGDELLNLTPNTLEELLFDDIPFLPVAQEEHDAFANILRGEGVEVVYLEDLMAEVLDAKPELRQQFLDQWIYEAGIRTVCFISPIFPGITDPKAIIERVREYADLVWLENLNLRGQFKGTIMAYIREKHPELVPLYEDIYNRRRTDYWQALEREMADYAAANGMPYRVNDLPYGRSEKGHPVVVNYFYHEKIRRSNR
mgnify:CR=1 FL=1